MVNAEIKELMSRKNDVITRAIDMVMLMGSKENLDSLRSELSKLQATLEEKKDVISDG